MDYQWISNELTFSCQDLLFMEGSEVIIQQMVNIVSFGNFLLFSNNGFVTCFPSDGSCVWLENE